MILYTHKRHGLLFIFCKRNGTTVGNWTWSLFTSWLNCAPRRFQYSNSCCGPELSFSRFTCLLSAIKSFRFLIDPRAHPLFYNAHSVLCCYERFCFLEIVHFCHQHLVIVEYAPFMSYLFANCENMDIFLIWEYMILWIMSLEYFPCESFMKISKNSFLLTSVFEFRKHFLWKANLMTIWIQPLRALQKDLKPGSKRLLIIGQSSSPSDPECANASIKTCSTTRCIAVIIPTFFVSITPV